MSTDNPASHENDESDGNDETLGTPGLEVNEVEADDEGQSDEIASTNTETVGQFNDILLSTLESDPMCDADGAFNLHVYTERAYLEYAYSVVKGRSLPDVTDGQKPVQRRILYAMRSMGLTSTSRPMKSARVVGEVMGKYHPHGDSSIYDAMVLSSQDFSRRYPLVDGQGNFGSRDGDGAAAMRYTEARLTKYAELLLSEIDRGTVDFIPNYDGAFEEPATLPARLPMILLNGSKGAAVGYATEIPSHNLREVASAALALIKNPQATLDEVMEHILAPDFPGGGQIISPRAVIREAYANGRGSLKMRARWRREDLARGQWRIVIYELPDGISTANILAEIEMATNPQPKKGKKDLSQNQKNVKTLMLGLIESARDESDKAQPIRLVLEPKTSKISEDELMSTLLAQTSLEYSAPMNLVVIGRDGNPRQKPLLAILQEWIDYRFETVERRTTYRLNEVRRRLHILEGRMIALLRIEEVIRIIRESEEPRSALMERIGLSEIQAEDILEIRLRQLAKLEGLRIETEIKELRIEELYLVGLLSDRQAMTNLIIEEITSDMGKYGDDRRTILEVAQAIREVGVSDEPCTIIISKGGWLRSRQGHGIDPASITWKQSDTELAILETRTTHNVIILDTNGRVYSIRASAIPGGRGDGVPINTLLELQSGAKVAHVFSDEPGASYFFANSASYGFISQIKELESRGKAGKAFMTIEAGETIMTPLKVNAGTDWIAACSFGPKESRLLMFPVHEMKVLARGGRGVMIMNIDDSEKMVALSIIPGPQPTAIRIQVDSGQTVPIKGDDLTRFMIHRAKKGCQISKKARPISVA